MNKIQLYITSILAASSMLNIGCVSTVTDHAKSAYDNVRRELQSKPGSSETDALYNQVRAEDQIRVQQLRRQLEITKQTKELANLEKKRDDLQRDRSRTNEKAVEYLTKETQYKVELAKLEAIDRNRLGDKIANIERIADTHVEVLEIQQKRLQLESDVTILDVRIVEIKQQITTKQNSIKEITTG